MGTSSVVSHLLLAHRARKKAQGSAADSVVAKIEPVAKLFTHDGILAQKEAKRLVDCAFPQLLSLIS